MNDPVFDPELEAEWDRFEEEFGRTTVRVNSAVQHVIGAARNAFTSMTRSLEAAHRLERTPTDVAAARAALPGMIAGIEAARSFLVIAQSSQMTRLKLALTITEAKRMSDELQDAVRKTTEFLRSTAAR